MDKNPYAPPTLDTGAVATSTVSESGGATGRIDITQAAAELRLHLADHGAVATDRALEGGPLRRGTIVLLTLTLVCLVGSGVVALTMPMAGTSPGIAVVLLGIGIAVIFGVSAAISWAHDRSIIPRRAADRPDAAMRAWLNAIRFGRSGYVVAAMCPTARRREMTAPSLRPVVTGPGAFVVDSAAAAQGWLQTFARMGTGQVRSLWIKDVDLVADHGDWAELRVRVRVQSWPNWANILSIALFVVIRLLGLVVGAVLFFTLRKQRDVAWSPRMLRGDDGSWYVLDAQIGEQALV